MSSIFTKIINGEIPSQKIYEDDRTVAFLDIHPIQPGHTLVVPKKEVEKFDDLEPEDYTALFATVQKIAKQVRKILNKPNACIRIEGFDVPHAHVHVYPCASPKDFYGSSDRLNQEPDIASLEAMAKKLAL